MRQPETGEDEQHRVLIKKFGLLIGVNSWRGVRSDFFIYIFPILEAVELEPQSDCVELRGLGTYFISNMKIIYRP